MAFSFVAAAAAAQGPPAASVAVSPAVRRTVRAERSFVGMVEALRTSLVGSDVPGLVVEYLVDAGDRVDAGAVLAQLRTEDLDIEIEAARAVLEMRRQELAELENGSRPEEIARARAALEQAEADVEYRAWKIDRTRDLFERDSVSEDDLQLDRLELARAQRALDAARQELTLMEKGPREERVAQARAQVLQQEQAVRLLEDRRERHTIRAPFAGHVVAEHVEVGQWLAAGGSVVEISDLSQVYVTAAVPEGFVDSIGPGLAATVAVDALDDARFTGEVAVVVPRAEPLSRTFPVKVRLQNQEVRLKAGMIARVLLPVGDSVEATLVPKDALVFGGGRTVVYVVADGVARPVPVELGAAFGGLIAVRGEIGPGAKVVVRGNERLMPGAPVQIVEEIPAEDVSSAETPR